ncbi:formate dehydrogenase accessory protein FdhE [Alsobacter sp. SYSU M60028]|uniref:Protein FdhE homolog n=1 Tax=Alsobacter ponti TaxID=2962936 RepID=A0ABT1L7U4_9HYPH|nr:formate dehydrogenase accessory protein FdhE [Alsobacter ponti]MCP8937559.1 formate dehydrogenase accessory protein FdhE [Alsobacter ponti]
MSSPVAPQFQPVHIGDAAEPPLAVAPDPASLFARRAARFRDLVPDHPLGPYLAFLGDLAGAQAAVVADLPPPSLPAAEQMERAYEHGMAPIARASVEVDAAMLDTLSRLFDAAAGMDMPEASAAALAGVRAASPDEMRQMIGNVLEDALPAHELAEHVFVAAGLQVHFARLAASLAAERLSSVADGACPACGGPPVASEVVGWSGAHGTRFVSCATCATRWHVVRIKCVACSSTKGIRYSHVEGTADTIKAECCDACGCYLKIFHTATDPKLDPVADDVASAGLDLMVREEGYRRAGFNVFLAGF